MKSLKLGHKLLLAFALLVALSLVAFAGLMQWNLKRGFLDYLNAADSDRAGALVQALAQRYASADGWDWLQGDPRAWRAFLRRQLGPGDFFRPPIESTDARPRPRPFAAMDRPPEGPILMLDLADRLTVLDADKMRLMGGATWEQLDFTAPIEHQDEVIGWLGLTFRDAVRGGADRRFVARQQEVLLLGGAGLLVISALLAWWLSRQLLRPIERIRKGASRLARGDYQVRLRPKSRDEFGELTARFNSLAEALDKNERSRQRWMTEISHELRTPVTVLRGEIEALLDGIRPLDHRSIESLHQEAVHLEQLVQHLRELTLSDIGALDYQMEPVDLAELLEETFEHFRPRFDNVDLAASLTIAENLDPVVEGDRPRLRQLLSNLLENSLRYTDAGGPVKVSLREIDGTLLVEIEDGPPGVASSSCERLFERFYRMEPSRSRRHGGSGLGLAICRNIAEAHGATIEAEPSALGGLSIRLRFPAALDSSAPEEA